MAHQVPGTDAASASFGWGWRLALALALLLFSWMYVQHPVGRFTRGGLIHGDGVYYYAYARSLVHDRDVDFENDYALLGNPHARPRTKTGLLENRFTIGPALLWTPSFLLAEGVVRVGAATGFDAGPRDGSGPLQQRVTLYASVLWGFAAIVLSALLARRFVSARVAGLAGLGILLASPLPWYMIYQPSWPHAASAFAVAAFVFVWHRGYRSRGTGGWIALGLLAGLMGLVRPQSVVFTLLPAFELGAGIVASARAGAGRDLLRGQGPHVPRRDSRRVGAALARPARRPRGCAARLRFTSSQLALGRPGCRGDRGPRSRSEFHAQARHSVERDRAAGG